jgi:hypothetical protein
MRASGQLTVLLVVFAALLTACHRKVPESSSTSADVTDPQPSAAQSARPMPIKVNDLDWLVRNSPFVFVGRLTDKTAERDSRGLVVTRNRFAVEDAVVGGTPPATVTLTLLGGMLGNEEFTVSHTPDFVPGQRYMIFTDLQRTTYNPITADEHGVFLVVDSNVYTYDGRGVAGVQDGKLRFSSELLERDLVRGPRPPGAYEVGNPTVGGGVISARRTAVTAARPMSVVEFSRLVRGVRR